MTQSEALEYYKQIEFFDSKEIRKLIKKELQPSLSQITRDAALGILCRITVGFFGGAVGALPGGPINVRSTPSLEDVESICKDSIKNNSSSIKQILQKHPNYTNYVIDIIMLLAPAIAQQYIGIPGIAIVGSITILCKQGIQAYLQ